MSVNGVSENNAHNRVTADHRMHAEYPKNKLTGGIPWWDMQPIHATDVYGKEGGMG